MWRAALAFASTLAAWPADAAPPAGNAPKPRPVQTQTISPKNAPADDNDNNQGAVPLSIETATDVTVSKDIDALPPAVRRTRQHLLDAAQSGDLEQLKLVMQYNEMPPSLPAAEGETDPVAIFKALSGDENGRELLAIMIELLELGYAHIGVGTPQEMYVWPYVAALPLAKLTPSQEVDLYQVITPGDRADMEIYGQYVFYRIGISPDGVWHYFLTGE